MPLGAIPFLAVSENNVNFIRNWYDFVWNSYRKNPGGVLKVPDQKVFEIIVWLRSKTSSEFSKTEPSAFTPEITPSVQDIP